MPIKAVSIDEYINSADVPEDYSSEFLLSNSQRIILCNMVNEHRAKLAQLSPTALSPEQFQLEYIKAKFSAEVYEYLVNLSDTNTAQKETE